MRAYLPTALRGLQRQNAAHPRRPHPWVMVWTMAVAQVISWGTLFYAFSLFRGADAGRASDGRVLCSTAPCRWAYSARVWWPFPSGPGLTATAAGAS